MAQRWMKATDTFVGVLKDGSQKFVSKGDPFPEGHELVRRDQDDDSPGRSPLFAPLDQGDSAEVPPKSDAEAEAAEKAPPVKLAGKKQA